MTLFVEVVETQQLLTALSIVVVIAAMIPAVFAIEDFTKIDSLKVARSSRIEFAISNFANFASG